MILSLIGPVFKQRGEKFAHQGRQQRQKYTIHKPGKKQNDRCKKTQNNHQQKTNRKNRRSDEYPLAESHY